MRQLILMAEHERAGALLGTLYGSESPRHYGDPAGEYRAASEGVAVTDRSYRARLALTGRAPVQMLAGIITNRVPPAPSSAAKRVLMGQGAYAAVLTPKGKMVTDLRVFWRGGTEADGLLLDVPLAGLPGLRQHFEKYLPPRFATVEELSPMSCMLTVLGPEAAHVVTELVVEPGGDPTELQALAEDEYRIVGAGDGEQLTIVRTREVRVPAYDLIVSSAAAPELWRRLTEGGCAPVGMGVWETLRIEAGRPAYGPDMDATTIPTEAGIDVRAIDHGKGCYTGQEVIVRIRDRGRVNWHLRGLHLGEAPAPAPGTELFQAGGERPLGRVTSAAASPHFSETIALGYVRREVEPPAEMRLGAVDGPAVRLAALGPGGWDGV